MAFRPDPSQALAGGIALRAALLAMLSFGLVQLLAGTRYYASALVLLLLALLVLLDLVRLVSRAARPVAEASAARRGLRFTEQRREDTLQALLDTVSAALILLREDGSIVLANRAALLLAGRDAGTLGGLDAIGPEAAAQLHQLPVGSHRILRLASGQRVLASAARFAATGEGAARLLSLQRIAGELDAVELQAWEDMTRVLAHEMMNSLTPIASLSESLESQLRGVPVATEAAESLEAIRRRSRGLMDFVDRYRRLAERPRPEPVPLQLEEVIAGLDVLMSATLRERGIACRSRVQPAGLVVRADRQLLEQALLNLLRNAIDAVAKTDAPRIDIDACAAAEGIEISVTDNGPGLGGGERERIFVPFYTTKPGGSGIGLSLVRYVALAHGGSLEATDLAPRGARFTLRLPR